MVFTSYNDQTIAPVTNPLVNTPNPGDWGGIVYEADADNSANGIFLDSVDEATIKYGGGQVVVNSTSSVFDPIHLVDSQPAIQFNTILDSADAAMSADPNSFADLAFAASPNLPANPDYNPGLPTGPGYTADYGRTGPSIHGNILQGNSINGMFIRIRTQAGFEPGSVDRAGNLGRHRHYLRPDGKSGNRRTARHFGCARRHDPDQRRTTCCQRRRTGGRQPGHQSGRGGQAGRTRIETVAASGSQLLAEGTAANPIVLTSLLRHQLRRRRHVRHDEQRQPEPNPGDWAGLYFGPATSASLDYVILQYAGGQSTIEGGSEDSWNPIEVYQADVRIADSTLQDNAGGGGGNRNGRQSSYRGRDLRNRCPAGHREQHHPEQRRTGDQHQRQRPEQ